MTCGVAADRLISRRCGYAAGVAMVTISCVTGADACSVRRMICPALVRRVGVRSAGRRAWPWVRRRLFY